MKSIIISGRNANFMELQKNVDSIKQLMNGSPIDSIVIEGVVAAKPLKRYGNRR